MRQGVLTMQMEIEPLKKVTLDGIDIFLSMERAAVASRFGGGDAAAHRWAAIGIGTAGYYQR